MPASLLVCSLTHRTAPVEIRERLALDERGLSAVLDRERLGGLFGEALVLSTCNRLEVYGMVRDGAVVPVRRVLELLAGGRDVTPETLLPLVDVLTGAAAVRHCFRVASSLDSMIVGEPQILGQLKDALAVAEASGVVGPRLHRLFSQAFAVAKKVRTETELGQHAVSVSFAAVELAKKIFGGLRGTSVLLLGAGEMAQLAARHLTDQGVASLHVANRTWQRAVELADALGGQAVAFDRWPELLPAVDIVIASTGSTIPIVRPDLVAPALAARRARPLFLIDIALPRDVDAGVAALPDVFVYDLDDLQTVVDANLRERRRAAARAETLVEREVSKFIERLGELSVVPMIVSLREKLEAIRREELARALARVPDATPEARAALEALSSAIVNKVLHAPTVKLRESTRAEGGRRWPAAIAELFGLRPAPCASEPPIS